MQAGALAQKLGGLGIVRRGLRGGIVPLLFGLALAFPVALLTYGVIGIGVARVIGVGQFYSVPFGAEHIQDWHVVVSLAVWTCIWGPLIMWLLGRRRATSKV